MVWPSDREKLPAARGEATRTDTIVGDACDPPVPVTLMSYPVPGKLPDDTETFIVVD
jgi:hypothetical protein